MWSVTRHQHDSRAAFPMLREMFIEPGTVDDWNVLHDFHYKSEGKVMGARYYRVSCGDRLAGVVVMCYPRGLLKDRHKAFPNVKPDGRDTKITNTFRYKWLNKQFGLNARTVNDTLFRGIGLGYRMLNLAARMDGREFCEIQSSMSKFNEFAHRAGFRFVKPEPSRLHEPTRAVYAKWFDSNPVDQVAILAELRAMHPAIQARALADLKAHYFKSSSLEKTGNNRDKGTSRVDAMTAKELIKNLNQLAFSTPLYGVYKNPDYGRTLPARIPLIAFDQQPVTAPLVLEF